MHFLCIYLMHFFPGTYLLNRDCLLINTVMCASRYVPANSLKNMLGGLQYHWLKWKGKKNLLKDLKRSLLRHIEKPTVQQSRFVRDLIFWPLIIGVVFACLPVPLQALLEHAIRVLFGSGKWEIQETPCTFCNKIDDLFHKRLVALVKEWLLPLFR